MIITDIAQYNEFIGTYQHLDDELTISAHDNKFFLTFSYSQEMQLHREQDDLFFIQEGSDTIKLLHSQENGHTIHISSRGKETVYTARKNTNSLGL